MANIFKAKTLMGRSGIFSEGVIAPNLVYNTGNQTIAGQKTFTGNFNVTGNGIIANVFNGATLQLSGNRVLTTIDLASVALPSTIVYQSGNQNISGDKTFVGRLIAGTGFFGNNNRISGLWAGIGAGSNNFASGNYSYIGGGLCNRTLGTCSFIGGGSYNSVEDCNVVIVGGRCNCGSAYYSIIGGGECNSGTKFAWHSTLGGGCKNLAGGQFSTIGGGVCNYSTTAAFVGGGQCNCACGAYSTIGGGFRILTKENYSTIAGGENNCAIDTYTTIGGGFSNCATGCYSTIGGGFGNYVAQAFATVGGGRNNSATAIYANVGGGNYNRAIGCFSIVGGGKYNCATAAYANIGGGKNNCAAAFATIGGGFSNWATANFASVAGGSQNCAIATNATIGGGRYNCATGDFSTVGGGLSNCATATYANVGGGFANRATACWATVGGGSQNCATANYANVGGGKYNRATGVFSTIGGGCYNCTDGDFSTIAGGKFNYICGVTAFIGGGESNYSIGNGATIGGGFWNCASALYSIVVGGEQNRAQGSYSVVGGGIGNFAVGDYANVSAGKSNFAQTSFSTIGGGGYNCATGCYSAVLGGENNCAFAPYSYIVGGRKAVVQTLHTGAAVFGDGQNRSHLSSGEHTLTIDFASGVYFAKPNIYGTVNFATRPNVGGTGVLLVGEGVGTPLPSTIVYQSGNQNISGDKTFVGRLIAGTGFFGNNNRISGLWAGIGAGSNNFASGDYSFIGGGCDNCAGADYAKVGGGFRNCATESFATIGGGINNQAFGDSATIGGGRYNCATATYANIGGGSNNCATGDFSTVGGGRCNIATAIYSTVGGGNYNRATAAYANIGGGEYNCATAIYSTVGGGYRNCATGSYSTIGGGRNNSATAIYSNVGGGYGNCATGCFSTVGGGDTNRVFANHGYIIGGRCAIVQEAHSGAAVLGDGQNRSHLSSGAHTLALDFASGVYFAKPNIYGTVNFATRPNVGGTGVLLSGENANGINVFVKNDDFAPIQKGQPVYIFGANGNNILVRRAANTGEATSSKTLGLLNQTLAPNDQGYVISEGELEGINTSAGNAGDPVWLGPTGNLIFGLTNKPYAPNHLVYLGVVERQQSVNGKIYVKVQNGFELEELHNVNINHYQNLNDGDILRYIDQSGIWFNQPLETGIFQTRINLLSGVSVLKFGNQIISGTKTFLDNQNFSGNINISGTGIFNALDLNNIDDLSISGVNITIKDGNVISNYPIIGSNLVYKTGNQNISGTKNFFNSIILKLSEDPNDQSITINDNTIDLANGFDRGLSIDSQNIDSNEGLNIYTDSNLNLMTRDPYADINFATRSINRAIITTDGNFGIGANSPSEKLEVNGNIKSSSGIYANNLVYNTGNQTISGTKTFNSDAFEQIIIIDGYDEPQLYINSRPNPAVEIKNNLKINSFNTGDYFDQPKIYIGDAGLLKGTGPKAGQEYRSITFGANITDTLNGADISKVYDSSGEASPIITLAAGPIYYAARNGIYFSNNTATGTINQIDNLMFMDMEKSGGTYGAVRIGNFEQPNRLTPTILSGYKLQVDGNIKADNIIYNTGDQTIIGNKLFSGNSTSINLISGATLTISGASVLTGILGTGNFITLNDLNQSYKNLYISPNGNDTTAQIGNINRPYATAQAAYNAIAADLSPAYILNFYGGSWTINVGSSDWPLGIGIRGLGSAGSFVSQAKPSLSLTNTPASSSSVGASFRIVDFGNQSINLSITSQGGNYGGGLSSNGGNGGDIYLYNAYGTIIQSLGGVGGGGLNNIGGQGGNIYLYNSEVQVLKSFGAAGSSDFPFNRYNRGGGNLYIENSKILLSLEYNSTPTNTLPSPVSNKTINIINSIHPTLPFTSSAIYTIKNSYNSTTTEGILSSNYSGGYYYDNFSIRNNNLSGILNNLTLHDNQNRIHRTGQANSLTIDFSGGLNIANNVNISGGTVYVSGNPILTGVDLSNYVQLTGPQNIGGTKTFISNTLFQNDIIVTGNIRATGTSYFNDNLYISNNLYVSGNINNPTLVLTKNKQTISGDKTFADTISLNAYTGNGYDISNLDFRLNVAGNTNENVGISIDAYGINGPQILMRRARGIPTGLSGVLKDDVLFNLQGRGYISGLNQYSSNSRAAIRSFAAEDWVVRDGYTGQGTYISFRTTNIGSGLAIDKVIVNTSGLNVVDGNIYISGAPVLTGLIDSYATSINLASTGSKLDSKINALSGNNYLTSSTASTTYATITNLASTGSTLDSKINSLSGNLTSTYGTISNLALTGSTLDAKINSLSGTTLFVINYGHVRNNTTAGPQYYYFGPQMDIDPVSLANNEKRRVQILQNCFLKKVVWTSIAKTNAPTPSNAITGYFKNFGNNALTDDQSAGIRVTSGINIPASNIMYSSSTGDLNIPITGGNYISFYYQTNFNAGSNNIASGLAMNVSAYFYV